MAAEASRQGQQHGSLGKKKTEKKPCLCVTVVLTLQITGSDDGGADKEQQGTMI